MTAVQRLVSNGNSIINFLKKFSSSTPQDVSVDWVNDDGSVDTKAFANIKKFQDSVNMTNDGGIIKDLNGNIIAKLQPIIYFEAYVKDDWDPGDGSGVTLTCFKDTRSNIGGSFDTSNSKFTAPVKGLYTFSFNLRIDKVGDVNHFDIRWRKNGEVGTYAYMSIEDTNTDRNYWSRTGTATFLMDVGDTMELYHFNNHDDDIQYSSNTCHFTGALVQEVL